MQIARIRVPHCLSLLVLLAAVVACTGIGPQTIPRDRFNYGEAITHSQEEQMLMNMVRLRYGEVPVFMDVVSVINQYALEGQVQAQAGFDNSFTGGDSQVLGGAARWADRPTITYAPLRGADFTRSLLTPLPPSSIFSMVQAGWPVELTWRLTVRSINGVKNRYSHRQEPDPEFYQLLNALSRIQESGAVGLRQKKSAAGSEILVFFTTENISPELEADTVTVRKILGLAEGAGEASLVYGAVPQTDREIAVITNSVMEIMISLGAMFEIPAEHSAEGRSIPTVRPSSGDPLDQPMLRVRATRDKPKDAFVAVQMRDHWYSISDRDLASKRVFAFLLILLNLADTEPSSESPSVTITTGGL